jgi:MFS family permease
MVDNKPRLCYIIPLAASAAMGFVVLGYCFAYYNSMTSILHKQYVHKDEFVIPSEDLFNSLVSGLIPLGASPGTLLVAPLAKKGRRLALIVVAIIMIFATSITMIFNMFALIIGRFIMGM